MHSRDIEIFEMQQQVKLYIPATTILKVYLVLGSITDEALGVCEGHIAGRRPVALVVRNDLDPVVLPDTHTAARELQSQHYP